VKAALLCESCFDFGVCCGVIDKTSICAPVHIACVLRYMFLNSLRVRVRVNVASASRSLEITLRLRNENTKESVSDVRTARL
jgi:hypothetical protein